MAVLQGLQNKSLPTLLAGFRRRQPGFPDPEESRAGLFLPLFRQKGIYNEEWGWSEGICFAQRLRVQIVVSGRELV
jgi:hypothetical protein